VIPPPVLKRYNFTLILNLDAAACPLYAANQATATALAKALVASKPTTKITQATASFVGCAPYSPTTERSIGMAFNVFITAPEGADMKILEWFNSDTAPNFCSVLPASFCNSLPGAVESTEARPPITSCFLDQVVTQLPSVPALVLSTLLNISQINSQLQNWQGVSSWVVETDGSLLQEREVAIVGNPPTGGAGVGNGALFLRTFSASAQVAVEGTLYAGPSCPYLSASASLVASSRVSHMGFLGEVAEIAFQMYATTRTADLAFRLRVVTNPNPAVPVGFDDVVDLIWQADGTNDATGPLVSTTAQQWNSYTGMQANQWWQRRRQNVTGEPGPSSLCPASLNIYRTPNATNPGQGLTIAEWAAGVTYDNINGCRTVQLSAASRVISLYISLGTGGSPDLGYYVDTPLITFDTSFPAPNGGVVGPPLTYTSNFEVYPEVTMPDIPGPDYLSTA